MPANDAKITSLLTPDQAKETLEKMIGQLEIVIDHFAEQKNVSTQTKAKTLADMQDQLASLKMGKLAIEMCNHHMPDALEVAGHA